MGARTTTTKPVHHGRTTTSEPLRFAIYLRISADSAGLGLGVDRQLEDCTAIVAEHGGTVVAIYRDNDLTASKVEIVRPDFERMLRDMELGLFDAVAVYQWDRLEREGMTRERFIALAGKSKVDVFTAADHGHTALSSHTGRFVARIVGALAQAERDQTSERVSREMDQRAALGQWMGGTIPYGYRMGTDAKGRSTKTLELRGDEAAVLRELAAGVLEGRSLGSLARELETREVPSAKGGRWQATTIRSLLLRPTTAGLRLHRGTLYPMADVEPILDRATWERVQAVLSQPERRANRDGAMGMHLCISLVRGPGGDKGTTSIVKTPYKRERAYTVRGASVPISVVDAIVTEAVMRRNDAEGLTVEAQPDEYAHLTAEIEALDTELLALFDRTRLPESADEYLYEVEYSAMRREVKARRVELVAKRDALRGRKAHRTVRASASALAHERGAIRAAWPTMNQEERRALLAALIDRIVLHGRWAEQRVEIVWR